MSNAKRLKIETIFELCEEPKIWWPRGESNSHALAGTGF